MKKAAFLLLAMMILLTGCQNTADIKSKIVKPLDEYKTAIVEWFPPYDLEDTTVVVGTITNVREVEVKYYIDNSYKTEYITKFDLKVDEKISPESLEESSIRVYTYVSSRSFLVELEKDTFTEGNKYLMFLKKLSDDKIMKKGDIADYMVMNPPYFFMIPENMSAEKINSFLNKTTDKNKTTIVDKYKEVPSKTFDNFKEFLREYYK